MSPSETGAAASRSFTLTVEEEQLIEAVKIEENLLSDSAALRRLIRDGHKYRQLVRAAEQEVAKQWVSQSAQS